MLAIIPARGGSKGLRGKNLRLLNGRPLLAHAVDTLRHVPEITRVVVTTDDPLIASVALLHGAEVIHRPQALALDDVPIAPVVRHALDTLGWTEPFMVFQPTCPTITVADLSCACRVFPAFDSLGFVTPNPHLMWDDNGPLYRTRRQRQDLDVYRELGVFISRSASLVGDRHYRYVVNAVDIDTADDLESARRSMARKHIEFRAACSKQVGSGHLYRCLALADELAHHDVNFAYQPGWPTWARDLVDREQSVNDPDLVIFDKLDTSVSEVAAAKADGALVVTLEDLGPGAELADLVVNELYESPGALCGPKWAVLRPEFCGLPPFEVVDEACRVLVAFGGTDPAGLSERVAPIVAREAETEVLFGPGRDPVPMYGVAQASGSVAQLMRHVDLVVCSAGRMAHEAAAVGVPCVTVAANERESRHTHCDGILRLGLHVTVSDGQIQEAVRRVLASRELRQEMSVTARAQVDGLGARRVVHHIDGLLEGL